MFNFFKKAKRLPPKQLTESRYTVDLYQYVIQFVFSTGQELEFRCEDSIYEYKHLYSLNPYDYYGYKEMEKYYEPVVKDCVRIENSNQCLLDNLCMEEVSIEEGNRRWIIPKSALNIVRIEKFKIGEGEVASWF